MSPSLQLVKGQMTILTVAGSHFLWATYDRETKEPVASAGGTLTLKDGMLSQRYEFASKAVRPLSYAEQVSESCLEETCGEFAVLGSG
jgi:hypothetical protein